MWSCPIRAGQSPEPQSPWEPAPSARAQLWARSASPAEFPARIGLNQPAHSNPYGLDVPALGAVEPVCCASAVRASEPPVSARRRRDAHPGKEEQAELVDSMEVPGQSCLWIPKCWGRVWNVFSFRLEHLRSDTRIIHEAGDHKVCASRHIQFHPGIGILAVSGFWFVHEVCASFPFGAVPMDGTIKSLVDSPIWHIPDDSAAKSTAQPNQLRRRNHTWQ
jgi:hypothetical protein